MPANAVTVKAGWTVGSAPVNGSNDDKTVGAVDDPGKGSAGSTGDKSGGVGSTGTEDNTSGVGASGSADAGKSGVGVGAESGTTDSNDAMARFKKIKTYIPGQFTDVKESDWFNSNVADAYNYGLMQGDSATIFNPEGNITVAEAVTVAARVHSIYNTGEEKFIPSSPPDPWHKVYVDYAIANNIIPQNIFMDFERFATRAEMAFIFSRSLPESEFTAINTVNSLPDVNEITPYKDAIFMLYKAGVLGGNDALGTFFPGANITRAEAAAIITRAILPSVRLTNKSFG